MSKYQINIHTIHNIQSKLFGAGIETQTKLNTNQTIIQVIKEYIWLFFISKTISIRTMSKMRFI